MSQEEFKIWVLFFTVQMSISSNFFSLWPIAKEIPLPLKAEKKSEVKPDDEDN